MSADVELFRKEVAESDAKRAFGNVLLVYPVSNYIFLAGAGILLLAFCVIAFCGHYTRHATVPGVLEPTQGVVKLYASQNGTLKAAMTGEGRTVKKGDILLIFESEHRSANGLALESELNKKLTETVATLQNELGGTLKLQEGNVAALKRNLAALEINRGTLRGELLTQNKRIQLAQEALARHDRLHKAGFVPEAQFQQKMDDLMDQQQRLQALEKSATSADAEIANIQLELQHSPLRQQVAKAQIDRSISNAEAELSKQQSGHEWSVVAPCDGIVTSLTITSGQSAGTGIPLLSIVPANSRLQANVYAPSRALGFLQPGQVVKIKLDAFPYQKFGLAEGRVVSISESPVGPNEISPGSRLGTSAQLGEPMYTVRVAIENEFVEAYGKKQRLRPGMQLSAEIQLDTRALYEWVLEPLYSLRRS